MIPITDEEADRLAAFFDRFSALAERMDHLAAARQALREFGYSGENDKRKAA